MPITIFGASNFTTAAWGPDTSVRGTWDLIQTCIITLSLCVYTALHLNVFHRECPWWARCLIRLKWTLIALLAPEFVVFNAWFQRRQAGRIARMLRRRYGQPEPESYLSGLYRRLKMRWEKGNPSGEENGVPGSNTAEVSEDACENSRQETFQLKHGFLIVMGGLVLDMTDDEDRVWPEWCNTLTITPACLEDCLNGEAFQDISFDFLTAQSIDGRTQVDALAKCLAMLQAIWFCAQFFSRIQQRLPVSLLELNTLAHAVCALVSYGMWWNKPGEITDPFAISSRYASEELKDLCAAQWTLGCTGKHYEMLVTKRDKSPPGELRSVWEPSFTHGGFPAVLDMCRGRRNITLSPGTGEDWYLFRHGKDRWLNFPRHPKTTGLKIRSIHTEHENQEKKERLQVQTKHAIPGTNIFIDPQFESIEIDSLTLTRWQRTFREPQRYISSYAVWLRDRQPNFSWPRGLDSEDGPAVTEELTNSTLMFLATSLCYGALHMLAWDSGVLQPQTAHDLCWKISSMLLVCLAPVAFVFWTFMKWWRGHDVHLHLGIIPSIVGGLIVVLILLAYVAARVYLLVEVFLIVPYMDPEVYVLPDYSVYWPHLG